MITPNEGTGEGAPRVLFVIEVTEAGEGDLGVNMRVARELKSSPGAQVIAEELQRTVRKLAALAAECGAVVTEKHVSPTGGAR